MVREDYSQSSLLTTLVGKPTDRYKKYDKDIDTLKELTDQFGKPNNRLHYSIYPQIQNEYQATLTQLEALDFYSPVVEVIGNITVSHRVNTPYNDQGVIINDVGSELVSTTSTVDENTFGTYQVVYTATDGINEDTVVKRIVKVGLPPDVTINGNNPYILQKFDTFIDPGVTINDSNSYLQSTTSTIISDLEGVYTVNYTVTNPAFTEIFSREVRVVDTIAPVITILGDNPYTLERFDRYIDAGATVDQGSVLTNTNLDDVQNTQIGSFDVVYTAYDGNSTTIETRTVNVVDTVPPELNILGGLSVTLERFAEYVDLGAETDLGSQITVDLSNVDNTLPHGSTFDVVYTASDGNTLHDVTQTRTVTIQDTIPPSITLLGDNPYFMEPDYNFADLDPGYEVDLGTSVSVNYSAINNIQSGLYDVIYTASDGVNQDVVVTRTVEVADRVPPIVTILGDNPYTLERYDTYTDAGATVDIGSTLVSTTSTVDNTEVGSYTVTYEAADGVNENTIVTRTVNVVDTNAPIVTLNNPELNPINLERFAVFADIDPGIHMTADQSGTLVSVDISELDNTAQGTYTVTYNVVDDQNNSNLITRGVTVVDTVPPVVTLREPNTPYTLERFALWSEIDPGVDIDEGSYIHSVSVNNTQIGVQTVSYDVRDGTNITTVTRPITVSDTVAPVITVNPPTSVTIERYSTYTDLGATADEGSQITNVDTSSVDMTNVGEYTVTYTAYDGNTYSTATRTVNVVDTTGPSIVLTDHNPGEIYQVERYSTYVEPGASAGVFVVTIDSTQVNTSTVGTYYVTYTATDEYQNSTTMSRRVDVVDTTGPVITLNDGNIGTTDYTVERYSTYTDPGYSADGGETVTVTGTVNTSVVGNYTLTYSATDDQDNTSSVTRLVTVQDTTGPVITLNDGNTGTTDYTVERYSTYTDPGYSADGGETVTVTGTVNMSVVGNYTLTYSATDDQDNTSSVTRLVTVQDTTGPVITLSEFSPGTIDYTLERFGTYVEPGASAGIFSVSIDTSNIDASNVGTYYVTYRSTDENDNTTTRTRTVYVVDTTPPVITLNTPISPTVERYSVYTDPGATASGPDGTFNVTTTGEVDTSTVGTYTLTYTATDDYNNYSTATRTVTVQDTTGPVITLAEGDSETTDYTVERFTTYTDPGYSVDGGETVTITGTVNTSVVGDYTLTYSATDDQGNTSSVVRNVYVRDTNAPIVTILGSNPDYVERGSNTAWVDPGSSSANEDIESTTLVSTTIRNPNDHVRSVINSSVLGDWTVTYVRSDGTNTGSNVRTVTVRDTISPTITILGDNPYYVEYNTDIWIDQGSSADETTTVSVTITDPYEIGRSEVSNTVIGTWIITYTHTDVALNTSSATREVIVRDTTDPVVTVTGSNPYYVELGTGTWTDQGSSVTDESSASLTSTIIRNPSNAVRSSIDNSVIGNWTVTYVYTDAHGNIGSAVRTVTVRDTTDPDVTVLGNNPYYVEFGTGTWTDQGSSVTDESSTSFTGMTIRNPSNAVRSSIDNSVIGNWTVTYVYTDAHGNIGSAVRTVTVRDTTDPVVTVTGSNPYYVERGTGTWTDQGSSATDESSTTFIGITIRNPSNAVRSSIDNTVIGDWTVTYLYTDAHNNEGSAVRTVTVRDTTDPVVTVLGNNPYYVELGTGAWTNQGSSVSDESSASLTSTIIRNPSNAVRSSIDNSVIGDWTVTYVYTDAYNNIGSAVRTVTVRDTTDPVVTVTGSNPYYVELGTGTWTDQGSSVTDESSASLTSTIIRNPSNAVRSSIDNSVIGNWTVTYVYTDAHGNIGSAVRTVTVRDTTDPVVTVTGSNPYYVERGTGTWTDQGSSATDESSTTFTGITIRNPNGEVESSIDNTVIGDWTVTYVYIDAHNNEGSAVRTVTVRDTTDPVVTVLGNNPYYVELGTGAWTNQGSSVSDESSASLTSTIIRNPSNAVRSSIDNSVIGNWTVTYVYTDAYNNIGSAVRTVTVRDTTDPVVTVTGSNPYYVELGTGTWTDQGSSVTDESSASLTSTIIRNPSNAVRSSIDNSVIGDWTVTYVYTDAYNNIGSAVRTVTVRDTTDPVVTVTGSNPYYVELGTGTWTDQGSSVTDESSTSLTGITIRNPNGEVESSIDNTVIGDWTVTYVYTDAHNNEGSVVRTVTVRDTTDPVVTVLGNNPYYVELGTGTWTDQGSSVTDESSASLTSTIIRNPSNAVASSIDNTVIGDWTVTYLYTDDYNNEGSAVRTVTVQDTTGPTVSISGDNPYYVELGTGTWTDEGSSATDESSVSLTSTTIRNPSNVIKQSIDNTVIGDWTVTYVYTDAHGNIGSAVRTVTVQDTTDPVVTVTGSNPYYVELGTGTWTDEGSSATDESSTTFIGITIRNPSNVIKQSIDSNVIGNWTVTYLHTDYYGNEGTAVRTVTVQDTTDPVVTVTGNNPYYVEYNSGTWTDQGSSVSDFSTTTQTQEIYNPSGTKVTSFSNGALGDWTIRYIYTDDAGNVGSADRTVTVQDTTDPVVTVTGSNPYYVERGTGTWINEGSSATDDSGATLTNTIIRNPDGEEESPIDNTFLGDWTVTYVYTDGQGNTGSAVRTVTVRDTTDPVVTVLGNNPYYVELGTGAWTNQGSSVSDESDASLTNTIIRNPDGDEELSIDNTFIGDWTVTYVYTDDSNNEGSAVRTVTVRDTTDPVVTVTGSNPYYVEYNSGTWTDQGSSVSDFSTTTNTQEIYNPTGTKVSSFSNGTLGNWTIRYIYTDAYGNSGYADRTVTVQDTTGPTVSISGDNPYYVEYGTGAWTNQGSSATDDLGVSLTNTIIRNPDGEEESPIDNTFLGDWTVTYVYTDDEGNTGSAVRTVTVQDTTDPVVTVTGSNPYYVELGTGTWTDEGSSATDESSTTFTSKTIRNPSNVIKQSIDNTFLGDWTVTYVYTDAHGNTGSAVRTVTVQDTTGPTVSISGDNPYYVELGTGTWTNQGSTATDDSGVSLTNTIIRNPDGEEESPIDNTFLGDWTVTYVYTDGQGNTGSAVRTVTVQDTTGPTVSIAGQNPYLIERGSGVFNEPGTTYTDYSTASLTSNTIRNPSNGVESSIDNTVIGDWTVTYVYTDLYGNTGYAVRIVRVQDTTGPTVTVNSGNDVVQAYTGTWIDAGSSYSDASTATLTKTIRNPSHVVRSSIDNNVIGTWTVTYVYTDAYGNTGSAVRNVVVSDTVGPVITVNPGTDTIEAYTGYWTDAGSSATDSSTPVTYVGRTIRDPNNASKTSISNNIIGTWVVTYTYKDAYDNYSSATRNVFVLDRTGPTVSITGDNPYHVEFGTGTWTDQGSSASDGSTTTFTGRTIRNPYNLVDSSIVNTVIGDWRVTYVYTDLYGNTGSNYRIVRVQDTIKPVVTVLGNNPYYVEYNSGTWSDQGSSVSDESTTSFTQEVYNPGGTKVSSFSNGTLGDWKIRYIYTDVSGNVGYADRTVTVRDTIAPVVTVNGSNPYTMYTTDTYVEYWATADGGETVTRSGYLNTGTVGTYYYTYSATDSSGNTGSAVRTIVVDAPPSGCFSDKTRVIMSDYSVRNLRDVLVGDELEGGIRVDAILQIRNIHSVPFYKLLDENTGDYIYVTGSHMIKYGGEFIYVKDHPDSVITDRVERTWLCLITDNHTIPIGGHIFWDWADMCDACEKPVISP